jgi:hypothetical protein
MAVVLFLLPLDGAGRLRADVIDHPVDTIDFIDYAIGDFAQQSMRQLCPIRRHGIFAGHCPDGDDIFIGPLITHYAYAFEGQQNGKRLP